MGQRERIVEIAREEIGYKEQGNNITKYGEWYGMQDAWCNMFVAWCAAQAGVSEDIIPKYAYVPSTANWFDARKQYKNSKYWGGNYSPKAGDIVLFDWDQTSISDHIGFVEKVEGNTLYTIEGNSNNMVARRTYSLDSKDLRAFCVPAYEEDEKQEEKTVEPTPSVPQTTVGQVKTFNKNTTIYDVSNLSDTGHSYLANTTVEILENLVDVDKVRVRANGYVGYVYKIDLYKEDQVTTTKTVKANGGLYVRRGPGLSYGIVDGRVNGATVTVYEERDGWSRIGEGKWVCSKYLV
jgi:hypothetical protein